MKNQLILISTVERLLQQAPLGVENCAGLAPFACHTRVQDDHKGTFKGTITVGIGPDGDAWIRQDDHKPIRFRNWMGGGTSPRTYAALILLAKAMAWDNADKPQKK